MRRLERTSLGTPAFHLNRDPVRRLQVPVVLEGRNA